MEVYDGPKYLTTTELAQRWHCSRGHLANQRSAGHGVAFYKIAGSVLYALADVELFEEMSRVSMTQDA